MRRILAVVAAAAAAVTLTAAPTSAAGTYPPITLAVIGDTPYGAEQLAQFPTLVQSINRDARVRQVVHLGDIKTGSSPCTDAYNQRILAEFGQFTDPLLYTPGDNEWTDCHRAAAGGHDPLERLDALRSVFFSRPGLTLGKRPAVVAAQRGFAENVRTTAAGVVFANVHLVGSDNGLAPWTNETPEQTQRKLAEVQARTDAALAWIDAAFARARRADAEGVVLSMQADTFIGTGSGGFTEIVRRIADRSRAFPGEVLLLQGDSHRYLVDKPLANGHTGYGIIEPVPNLTRVVVEGETASEWLRLTVDPQADELFTWRRMQLPG